MIKHFEWIKVLCVQAWNVGEGLGDSINAVIVHLGNSKGGKDVCKFIDKWFEMASYKGRNRSVDGCSYMKYIFNMKKRKKKKAYEWVNWNEL